MTKHEQLFEQYVEDLRKAKEFAERWWKDLEWDERKKAGGLEAAEKRLIRRWPNGPASHPRVLGVVRKYWLACDALNRVIAEETYLYELDSEPDYVLAPELESEEEDEHRAEEDKISEGDEVEPHIFVLEWLTDNNQDDLAGFLSSLTYWPVGLDQDDQYT